VDRKGLPAPEGEAYSHREYEEPQGEIELALAQIWQELLKVSRVGRDDNFFDLGGHSLRATQLHTRIQVAFGFAVPIRATFENPTLHQLATVVDYLRSQVAPTADTREIASSVEIF
jgi:acyl carrier protein